MTSSQLNPKSVSNLHIIVTCNTKTAFLCPLQQLFIVQRFRYSFDLVKKNKNLILHIFPVLISVVFLVCISDHLQVFSVYLCLEKWLQQMGVFHLSLDVRSPQSETRSGCKHLQIALFAKSWQEACSKPATAVHTTKGQRKSTFHKEQNTERHSRFTNQASLVLPVLETDADHAWHSTNTFTSCEVWCPTAGPPLFECSKAVIFAVWTPAAPGDCIPSEPHLKTLPTARRGYTHPAQGHKHTIS